MRNIYYILYIVYLKFELKSVTVNIVKKLMQKMQNKKRCRSRRNQSRVSSNWKSVLAKPLTDLINRSIASGIVPESWKEAVVIPILKKGNLIL